MKRRGFLLSLGLLAGCAGNTGQNSPKTTESGSDYPHEGIIDGIEIVYRSWASAEKIRYDGRKFFEPKNDAFVQVTLRIENLAGEKRPKPAIDAFELQSGDSWAKPMTDFPVENVNLRDENPILYPDFPGSYKAEGSFTQGSEVSYVPIYDVKLDGTPLVRWKNGLLSPRRRATR